MGAGGRHWEFLVQKLRVSTCAGVDNSRIQDAARERQEEEGSADLKTVRVEQVLIEGEGSEADGSETDLLLEETVKVDLDGTVSKEELGRSTWTFLHTVAAQFPLKPTKQQQRDAKELMAIISRLYPCKTCAEHFKEVLKTNPPKTNSGVELSEWMCQVHNIVNKSLGKPEFPCEQMDFRWGAFDCDGACSLHPHKYFEKWAMSLTLTREEHSPHLSGNRKQLLTKLIGEILVPLMHIEHLVYAGSSK